MCTPNHTEREAPGVVRKYVGSVCGSLRAGEVDGLSAQAHRSSMFGEMGHEEKVTWHCPSIEFEGRAWSCGGRWAQVQEVVCHGRLC